MHPSPPPTASSPTDPSLSLWQRRTDFPFIVTCLSVLLVTSAVHYTAFCEGRVDLSLAPLADRMTAACASLGPAFTSPATPVPAHPVDTLLGVAVWADHVELSHAAHAALDRVSGVVGDGLPVARVVRVGGVGPLEPLGLRVLGHALDPHVRMHGVRLLRADAASSCAAVATRRAVCRVRPNETTAAVVSVLAPFAEETTRAADSCRYALRALRRLEAVLAEHPEVPAPDGLRRAAHTLWRLVDDRRLPALAHAADDLQFHPLLLPQLYIPWDHALVTHVSILLPVLSMGLLAIRLAARAWKGRRREQKEKILEGKNAKE